MSRRLEEEYCKKQFDNYVRQCFPWVEVKWEDVKHDPPDYYAVIDRIRYAVEVTSLVEKIQLEGISSLGAPGVFKYLTDFISGVESDAKSEGSLHGQYVVSITPIDNFADHRCEIKEELLAFIRDTKDLDVAPFTQVFRKVILPHLQLCLIEKIGCQRDKIYESLSGITKWEGEIRADLISIVNERFSKKIQSLTKIPEPKILLLLDTYVYSDLADYKNCINQFLQLESFHTVFVIVDTRYSFILYSKDNNFAVRKFSIMPTQGFPRR